MDRTFVLVTKARPCSERCSTHRRARSKANDCRRSPGSPRPLFYSSSSRGWRVWSLGFALCLQPILLVEIPALPILPNIRPVRGRRTAGFALRGRHVLQTEAHRKKHEETPPEECVSALNCARTSVGKMASYQNAGTGSASEPYFDGRRHVQCGAPSRASAADLAMGTPSLQQQQQQPAARGLGSGVGRPGGLESKRRVTHGLASGRCAANRLPPRALVRGRS